MYGVLYKLVFQISPETLTLRGTGEERQSEEFSDARETTKATQIDYIYENI